MGSLLITAGCLSAILLTGSSAQASARDRSEEIRLKAENRFYGLSWEINIWRDSYGFHRTTTVRGAPSEQPVIETVTVTFADVDKLWRKLESLHCWAGPNHKDWALKEGDRGTVYLNRKGRQKTFNYSEFWNVATAISNFGQLNNVIAAARQKHLGKE